MTRGRGIDALVNNAGSAHTGPLEFVELDALRRQFEVNLIGQLAVTQAMLPMLRQTRGRIVNVTSVGGLVATPFLGPYAGSKYALEAFSDCLRTELRPWGIRTIAIEPGSIATEIWTSGKAIADEARESMPPDAERLYGKAMDATVRMSNEMGARGIPPEEAARVIHKALTVRRPKRPLPGRPRRLRDQVHVAAAPGPRLGRDDPPRAQAALTSRPIIPCDGTRPAP